MDRPFRLLCAAGTAVWVFTAGAAEPIIVEDFKTPIGDIRGSAPGTTPEDAVWQPFSGDLPIESDGKSGWISIEGDQSAVIELPPDFFRIHPGVYALSMDIEFPPTSAGKMWVAIGFTGGHQPRRAFNDAKSGLGGSGAAPWMLLRAEGEALVFEGPGSANLLANHSVGLEPGKKRTLKLELDTRDEATWMLRAFIDNTAIPLGPSRSETCALREIPFIHYAGFSASQNGEAPSRAAVSGFRLEKLSD